MILKDLKDLAGMTEYHIDCRFNLRIDNCLGDWGSKTLIMKITKLIAVILILLLNINQLIQAKSVSVKNNTGYLQPMLDSSLSTSTNNQIKLSRANKLLQGAIALTESIKYETRLKPIATNLRTGVHFDEKNLPKVNQTLDWFALPKWLGGTWYRKNERLIAKDNIYTANPEFLSEIYMVNGSQLDRLGNIWGYRSLPSITSINSLNYNVQNILTYFKILICNNTEFVVKTRSFQIYVNKLTNLIDKVQQNESVTVTKFLEKNQIQSYSKVQWYNELGFNISNDQRTATAIKIKSFALDNKLENGESAVASFKAYLTKMGLTNLIPNQPYPLQVDQSQLPKPRNQHCPQQADQSQLPNPRNQVYPLQADQSQLPNPRNQVYPLQADQSQLPKPRNQHCPQQADQSQLLNPGNQPYPQQADQSQLLNPGNQPYPQQADQSQLLNPGNQPYPQQGDQPPSSAHKQNLKGDSMRKNQKPLKLTPDNTI